MNIFRKHPYQRDKERNTQIERMNDKNIPYFHVNKAFTNTEPEFENTKKLVLSKNIIKPYVARSDIL